MEMNIKVTKTSDNKIDVRDSAGIRLMLLTADTDKGLYPYFEIRMAQAKEAKTRAEQALNLQNVSNFVLLLKPNYKAKDGTIKRGIEIDGKYYAPQNDC